MLKGIAIILMFVHHFFAFPGWWANGIYYTSIAEHADYLRAVTKICVCIFVFMTGYLFFYSKDKSYKKSFKKILLTYGVYWIIVIPFFALAILTGVQNFSILGLLGELLATSSNICLINWYMIFYAIVLLTLPLMDRFISTKPVLLVIVGIILPIVISSLDLMYVNNGILCVIFANIRSFYPVITVGYICAKYDVFNLLYDKVFSRIKHKLITVIIMAIGVVAVAFTRGVFDSPLCRINWMPGTMFLYFVKLVVDINLDVLYAPLFVFSFFTLLKLLPNWLKKCAVPVALMGQTSLGMWLISGVFFGVNSGIMQSILYFPRKAPLVLLWGLILCFIPAYLIDMLMRKINK